MAYVEYEADGKTIKARVQQKTDTLANWINNDMVIKPGEQAFVVGIDGTPMNFKIGDGTKVFKDLPNWIEFENAQRISAVPPGELPTPTEENVYMKVTGVGSYNYDGENILTITDSGYEGTLWWNGSEWIENSLVKIQGDNGSNGINGANYESDSQGSLEDRPTVVPTIPSNPNREYIYLADNGKYYAGIQGTNTWFEMEVGAIVYNIEEW